MGYNANSARCPSVWARVRNLQRTQRISKIRQPGLFGYTKNVNNHHHHISVAEDSLEDYCLLEFLGNEMDCGEREEHGLDGGTFDDDDPLQCFLDRQSSLIIATGYCCDSPANDRDERKMHGPFEGIMSSLSRQFSNSSQNSLSHAFPGEFGEEHGLDGGTFDDDPLQSIFALDRQSSLIIATGYCCNSPANDWDERKMQAGINSVSQRLCHSTMHSKDASDVDKGINLTEGPDSPKNSLNRSICL